MGPVSSASLTSVGFSRDLRSSPGISVGVGPSSVSCSSDPCVCFGDYPGTSGTSHSFSEDPLHFPNFDVASDKEDKESPSMGKREFSKAYQERIFLITTYFPQSKPSVSSESDSLIPWLDVFGNTHCRAPCVFVNLFENLSAIS